MATSTVSIARVRQLLRRADRLREKLHKIAIAPQAYSGKPDDLLRVSKLLYQTNRAILKIRKIKSY